MNYHFVCQLPFTTQEQIYNRLEEFEFDTETIQNVMDSKLVDIIDDEAFTSEDIESLIHNGRL